MKKIKLKCSLTYVYNKRGGEEYKLHISPIEDSEHQKSRTFVINDEILRNIQDFGITWTELKKLLNKEWIYEINETSNVLPEFVIISGLNKLK